MGQRLNLEIIKDEKTIANGYYHWSGFTDSALGRAKLVLNSLEKTEGKSPLARAVMALRATGADFPDDEYQAFKGMDVGGQIFIAPERVDRNLGLISVTENGIEETKKWGEQHILIDLDQKTLDVYEAFWGCDPDTYKEDMGKDFKDLPELDFELCELPFDQFDKMMKVISSSPVHDWKYEDDRVISFVE